MGLILNVQCSMVSFFFCFNILYISAENNASKMDEMRRKREERKLQRQREMEARRSARAQGPMKLGTKLAPPPL